MCYYTFRVRVRNLSNRGSSSAAFLFPTPQISVKYMGLNDLEARYLLLAGRTALR